MPVRGGCRTRPAGPALDFERTKQMVQKAEEGKFHGIFLSDILAMPDNYSQEALSHTVEAEGFEPFTLTSALAACTSKIGLALTAKTTYNEPYHVARKFASLDHISGGRAVVVFDVLDDHSRGHGEQVFSASASR